LFTTADWLVVVAFFGLMASLGFITRRYIHGLDDYFAGGHNIPWWLAAISHHVSGYSAFAFVGYASLAYKVGFNIWTVFALPVFLAMVAGAFIWAPRWTRLRVITPCEYLEQRFNNLVRQVVAWSGIGVKFVDEGAKLYSLAKIINACTGLPVKGTIIASCTVTILYLLMGGLWAELYSDFIQFIVQYGITLLLVPLVLAAVGGWRRMWADPRTPPFSLLSKEFPVSRLSVFFMVITLSYNGGTWGLAQRFYSMGKAAEAKKAALLSAFMYLLYPIALYVPVWAAPILVGQVQDPETADRKSVV
jgi:SSS family solute:Na+ symporter